MKPTQVSRVCQWCGAEFLARRSHVAYYPGGGKFCSRACRVEGTRIAVRENLPKGFRKCNGKQCAQPVKPETDEYFYRSTKGKLGGYCKVCAKEKARRVYQRDRDKVRDAYYANHEASLERARLYREANRESMRARQNEQRRNNREAYNQRAREYQTKWRRENPEAALLKGRANQAKNKDRYNALRRARYRVDPSMRQRISKYSAEWARRNPEKAKAVGATRQQRRRAAQKGLPRALKPRHWRECLAYWNGCCAVCGESAGLFLHIVMDHWIPLANPACPGTVPGNVLPLCQSKSGSLSSCNPTKSKRDPFEWLTWRLGARKAKRKLAEIEAYFASVSLALENSA